MKVKVTYSKLLEKEVEIDDKFLALTEKGREKLSVKEEYELEEELDDYLYVKLGGNLTVCCVETEKELLCEF